MVLIDTHTHLRDYLLRDRQPMALNLFAPSSASQIVDSCAQALRLVGEGQPQQRLEVAEGLVCSAQHIVEGMKLERFVGFPLMG